MADIKFSEFPKATTSKDSDEIAILQDGVNKMIASPVLESKIINKTVSRVIEQGGASLNVVNLKGVVPTYADLALITPTPELNDAYQVEADGLVYVYTENGFQADGDGFIVKSEPTGVVEEGNTQAVSGGTVYTAIVNSLAEEFNPLNDTEAVTGKAVNDWFEGVEGNILGNKNFIGTVLDDYPLGFYDSSGTFINSTTRRHSGKIQIPAGAHFMKFTNFSLAFGIVFFNASDVAVGGVALTEGTIGIPIGAVTYDFNLNSLAGSLDLSLINIDFIDKRDIDRKIVSPQDLENRIFDKGVPSETVIFRFNNYLNFDSFQSGHVDGLGAIIPDPTNVRKLSPIIDITDYRGAAFNMSIAGAYYRTTDINGVLVSFGLIGTNIVFPENAVSLRFTIKGSNSQSDLENDYINFKTKEFDYIVLKSDLDKKIDNQYIQISRANEIGVANINQWQDFSDGSGDVTLSEGGIKLLDNITTTNNQAKIRNLLFELQDVFTVYMKIKFLQLNDSYNMDILDGIINGYGETDATADDNINKSGFSFAVVHPTRNVRPIFSIVKAIDYELTGNLELWRIIKPTGFVAGFERIWSGQDIPMNEFFNLKIDFEFNTETDTNYYISIYVNSRKIVDRSLMGMISSYGGRGSLLFQCKGTSEEPAEYIVKDINMLSFNSSKANFLDKIIEVL